NAASSPYFGPAVDVDYSRFEKTWRVNVFAPLAWARAIWGPNTPVRSGAIVNVASSGVGTIDRAKGSGIYAASKASLLQLSRQMAFEYAPMVRVNSVLPGLVKTDLSRAFWSDHEPNLR